MKITILIFSVTFPEKECAIVRVWTKWQNQFWWIPSIYRFLSELSDAAQSQKQSFSKRFLGILYRNFEIPFARPARVK